MKRDTIFYRIFQQSPNLLFDLLPMPIVDTTGYIFDSVEVKEIAFRIDGVLMPPDDSGDVFFIEVQMQQDNRLYDRMHSEIGIYSYRYPERFAQWQAVAIYPSRSVEQSKTKVPQELFESGRIRAVYLDELGAIADLPPGLGLMVLTTLEGDVAIAEAKGMVARFRQTVDESGIIDLVTAILVAKFQKLHRDEVIAMLGYEVDEFKQSQFYQDVNEDGQREFALKLLTNKFGQLSSEARVKLEALNYDQLQQLSVDLLNFTSLTDLEDWLASL